MLLGRVSFFVMVNHCKSSSFITNIVKMVYNEGIIYFISIVSEVIAWKLLQEN